VKRFVSALGCTVSTVPAPDHLGAGVLLRLRMDQPGDGREAEVYLSPEDITALKEALS
jgi:hypothetical protein